MFEFVLTMAFALFIALFLLSMMEDQHDGP